MGAVAQWPLSQKAAVSLKAQGGVHTDWGTLLNPEIRAQPSRASLTAPASVYPSSEWVVDILLAEVCVREA